MNEAFLSALLMTAKSARLMNAKKASALPAGNILELKKWKPTTSCHGVKAEKLLLKTAKCFAKIAIVEKVAFDYPWPLSSIVSTTFMFK